MTSRRRIIAIGTAAALAALAGSASARSGHIFKCLEKAETEEEKQRCRWKQRGNGN